MRLIVKSLMMHRFRSLLSVVGVMIGVASLITMLSIGEGTKREILTQIEQLGIQNVYVKGDKPITPVEQQMITEGLPGLTAGASLHEERGAHLKTGRQLQAVMKLEVDRGRFLCDLDALSKHQVCVLGAEVARSLGPQGAPGKTIRIGDSEMLIVGVLAQRALASKSGAVSQRNHDETIFLPLSEESASEMVLQMADPRLVATASPLIQRILKHRDDLQLVVPQELLRQALKSQRMFHLVLGLIAATSLLVGGIGIVNVMMASVYERRSEIGIRRAVGASKHDIVRQFLSESLLLTAGGTAVGLTLGVVLAVSVSFVTDWTPVITWWAVSLSVAMAFFMGLSAGVYPAIAASRVDPIESLRS